MAERGNVGASVSIRFFGGIDEIGGTCVLIETRAARVVLDFGLPGLENGLLRPPAAPRPGRELVDLLRAGALRPIPGVFDPAQLPSSSPLAVPDPRPTAIILSHAHLDHEGALGLARPELPVIASAETAAMLAALRRAESPRYGHPVTAIVPEGPMPGGPDATVTIGDLRVQLLPVDHDVPGASGVIVTTPLGEIAYTGDLNFHRDGGRRSRAFGDRVRGARLLITETTTLSWAEKSHPLGEREIEARFAEAFDAADALMLVSLYPRDVDRVRRIIGVGRAHGRTIVVPGLDAALLALLGVDGVATWAPDRPQREVQRRAPSAAGIGMRFVTLEEVGEHPGAFAVQPDAADVPALADLPIARGITRWVHAQGEPLGPFMPEWELHRAWLAHLGVRTQEIVSSGHAHPDDLIGFVAGSGCGTVMPVHGLRPASLGEALGPSARTVLPRYGVPYSIDGEPIGIGTRHRAVLEEVEDR